MKLISVRFISSNSTFPDLSIVPLSQSMFVLIPSRRFVEEFLPIPWSVLKAHDPTSVNKNNYLMNRNSIKPGKFGGLPDFHDFSLTSVWEAVNLYLGSIQK